MRSLSILAHAENIVVQPIDCSPLARGEFGVVFKTDKFPKGQTYFAKGEAGIIYSKLLSGSLIMGYEVRLPETKLFSGGEGVVIKEFVVTSYDED